MLSKRFQFFCHAILERNNATDYVLVNCQMNVDPRYFYFFFFFWGEGGGGKGREKKKINRGGGRRKRIFFCDMVL